MNVDLQWTPGSNGNADITEYIIEGKTRYDTEFQEIKTVAASTTRSTLELKPHNTYNFQVKAVNRVGTSAASEASEDQTTPSTPPRESPTELSGQGPEPGTMVISWEVRPQHLANMKIFHYYSWKRF